MKYARFFILSFLAAFAAVAIVGTHLALAAAMTWSNVNTNYLTSDPQNWTGSVLPASGQDLNFSAGSVASWDLSGVVPASVITSADLTLRTPLIVSGSLRMDGGKITTGIYPLNIGGDFTLNNGSLVASGAPINISGSWKNISGNVTLAATAVIINGNADKSIASNNQPFDGLSIAAAGNVLLVDDLMVNGALAVSNGVLDANGKTITVQGGLSLTGGALSLGNGSLVLTGSKGRPLSISGGTFSVGSLSLVEYRPVTGTVAVEPTTYNNLKLTGTSVFSLADNATVNGALSIGVGAVFSPAGHTLQISSGQINNLGTISDGAIKCPVLSMRLLGADGQDISSIKNASGIFIVQVEDRDLNRKGDTAETAPAAITVTTLSGDRETYSLAETGLATGVFRSANLVVHQSDAKAGNGQIETGQSDIVFIKYTDPQDLSDVKTIQANVALSGLSKTGAPQIVAGPSLGNWVAINTGSALTYSVHVTWQTDMVSISAISVTSPQLTAPITAGSLDGTTNHDVIVTGLLRGVSYLYTVTSVIADGKSTMSQSKKFTVLVPGDRIKTAAAPAVYWYLGEKRNVFPDFTAYDSWFADWQGVVIVPAEQLADIPLGKVVPIRAGTYLIKIQSDPKTYAVEPYGRLRWIQTEAQAIALYGASWSKRVRDVDVSQFVSYNSGDPLAATDVPSGFVYKIAGGEWNAVIGRTTHQMTDSAHRVNNFPSRFVNSVLPATVAALSSAAMVAGYEPGLNGVFMDGNKAVDAPAAGL